MRPVVAGSKVLAFKSAPDFENPGDSNRNNIYEVTVEASDGTNTAMRDVTVKVTDAEEEGKVTLSTQQPRIGVPITATLADPDGSIANVMWVWERDNDAADADAQTPTMATKRSSPKPRRLPTPRSMMTTACT